MSNRKELVQKVKESNIETPKPPHMMKSVDLEKLLTQESKPKGKRGRPVDPTSERQKYLAELKRRRENGELHKGKTGRPVDPTSERQKYLAKKAQGLIKRGRPAKAKA